MQYERMLKIFSSVCFISLPFFLPAQTAPDTTRLTLAGAEKIFLQKNLPLVAARYNIDINKALAEQAKLWDNPLLSTDQNIYDGSFFRHNNAGGQVYLQVSQLIRTAGKRNKLAQLSTDNAMLSKEQLDDLMRTLRYTLRSDLLETDHLLNTKRIYETEITEVEKLSDAMNEEFKVGNVSMKDNVRLKALLFGLQNELVNVQSQLIPVQQEIKLLLFSGDSSFIEPVLSVQSSALSSVKLPALDSLLKMASASRPDMAIAESQNNLQKDNLVYQKAMAKPDISIGTEYDQRSSYANNYIGLAVSVPLNLFNHNQGNIKAAFLAVKQQEVLTELQFSKLKNEVSAALDRFRYYQQVNNEEQSVFSASYDKLFQNMTGSYRQRQISLLELVDFIDTYKDTKLKLLDRNNNMIKAAEDLNYSVNQDLIKII